MCVCVCVCVGVCVRVLHHKREADIKGQSEGGSEVYVCRGVGGMGPLYACQLSPRTRLP